MKLVLIVLVAFAFVFLSCVIGGDEEPDWYDSE